MAQTVRSKALKKVGNSFEKNWKSKTKKEQNKHLASAYTREARNNIS